MRLKLVPAETHVDFFSKSKVTLGASLLAMLASIVIYFSFGLNYGIDFRGGTSLMVETEQHVAVSEFREALGTVDVGDVSVTEISSATGGETNSVFIRIEQVDNDPSVQNEAIVEVKDTLSAAIPGVKFLATESVGAKVSGELVQAGIIAVVLAVAAVLFYIWLRFEWQFAVGAVAALVHDVVLTIGVFSLIGLEFNLSIIAAILTIVGYSLNDTVVVFDRVRENLRKYKTRALEEVLNLSINETLNRTVMTSVTTLIALIALYLLGGEVIRGFTFAMIWGVLVGTYSSIFVASAILLRLGVKRDWTKTDGAAGTQFANIDA